MPATDIFLDTHGLAAYINEDDPDHDFALLHGEELTDIGVHFVTTFAVLTETAELLLTRLKGSGRSQIMRAINAAANFVFMLEAANLAEIVQVDKTLWQRAQALMNQMSDKDWGITDCISFVVMQDRVITTAFTADRHFEQAGFRALLRG